MLQTYEQRSKVKLITTVVTVLAIAAVVVFADHLKSQSSKRTATSLAPATTTSASNGSSNTTSPTTNGTSSTSSTSFKDGTYTATSDYLVPHGGQEEIQVSLTLQSGTVTDVSIKNSESDVDSAQYQESFAGVYKNYVVGKKIAGLQLGAIAGASDTAQGFNDAVGQIETQAKA